MEDDDDTYLVIEMMPIMFCSNINRCRARNDECARSGHSHHFLPAPQNEKVMMIAMISMMFCIRLYHPVPSKDRQKMTRSFTGKDRLH